MSPRMQSSSRTAQARRTVQQLRMEASIERIKVCLYLQSFPLAGQEYPLLMSIPASENPFKDKKPCTVL
uniref:G protein gamma domain-containing protein n=1 Tax=Kryptolebias marmoratus TaxID=37003 RepID=A0A3Q2ZQW5_KRYMA